MGCLECQKGRKKKPIYTDTVASTASYNIIMYRSAFTQHSI
jgi:hypothetical protein